jgi:hypothetical protein
MQTSLPILSVAAAAMLVFSAAARADLVSVEADGATFTTAAMSDTSRAAPQAGTVVALAVTRLWADARLSETAAAVGAVALPAAGTASLWTFITAVRAQQRGDTFALLETHLSLFQLAEAPPAPVPLPPAAWLLVMGLLGGVGVRLAGRGKPVARMPVTLAPSAG